MNKNFQPGTVIAGTHNQTALIGAFKHELTALGKTVEGFVFNQDSPDAFEQTAEYVDYLISELNAIAPDGYYFGAHPDDGADFGFWPISE